ncbi:MAG: hypothetical protein ACLGG7_13430 [Bacteriovoracia bacterium]
MILALILTASAWAQSENLLGQYFHAKAEALLIEHLEAKNVSVADLVQDDVVSCVNLDEFREQLDSVRSAAQETLSDLKGNGFRWRQPQTYGLDEKMLLPPARATDYISERLRFLRLESFGRLSRLAPGCLNLFRHDPLGTRKSNNIPRFRLESLKNVSPEAFCSVTVRYWKEIYNELPASCKVKVAE